MIVKTDQDRENVIKRIQGLEAGKRWQIEIKPYKKARSLAQNALMWMWYTEIQRHILLTKGEDYSVDDIHEYFKQALLPKRVINFKNKVVHVQRGTSDLNIQEMTDYLFQLDRWCATKLELLLTHPDDLYSEAVGR